MGDLTGQTLSPEAPLATALTEAIHGGDVEALNHLLADSSGLAQAWVGEGGPGGEARSPLHLATDWPGHRPRVNETIRQLAAAGADVNARFRGRHEETPLHWAASCDDVEALDTLLDLGADIEAPGAVLGGGPPLANAIGFRQWEAARWLVERGARITFADAAALGFEEKVVAAFDDATRPTQDEIDDAFWMSCHGGRLKVAEYLLAQGADIDWLPRWENMTPLDAARREGAADLMDFLDRMRARSAQDLGNPRRTLFILFDGRTIDSVEDFHEQIARLPGIPSFYGRNLSALRDTLTGLVEGPIEVRIENAMALRKAIGEEYYDALIKVLSEAADRSWEQSLALHIEPEQGIAE